MASDANPLILIGGSVRAAAEDAAAAGYRVIALDRFGDRDLRAVCEHWQCLDEDWPRQIDAWPAAPIVPTGGFTLPLAGQLPAGRLIAYPDTHSLQRLSDPAELREIAASCAVGFPVTLGADQWPVVRDSTAGPAGRGDRWLIKPRSRTGGIGTRRFDPAMRAGTTPRRGEDLQQWVPGRPLGVSYFARRRKGQPEVRLLGACTGLTHRKHPHWPWLYAGSIGPQMLTPTCRDRLVQVGQHVAHSFELVGLFNIDFLLRGDGSLVLLEINPRCSASMELLVHDDRSQSAGQPTSLISWHLAAYQEAAGQIDTAAADQRTQWADRAVAGEYPEQSAPAELVCKRIIYARRPLRVDQTTAELAVMVERFLPGRREPGRREPGHRNSAGQSGCSEISFHDLPPLGQEIAAGHPALTVILRGSSTKLLAQSSLRIARELCRSLRSS